MKKLLLLIAFLPILTVNAQDSNYNKWSIELDGGITKPFRTLTPGYGTETPDLFVANLGVRYMLNTKFGFKADVGFHDWDNNSGTPEFETEYYRGSFQLVANLGNALSFKNTFLKNFGLLFHTGAGISLINTEKPRDDKDWTGHGIIGLTPQLKISERITLQGDFSLIANLSQDSNFDGVTRVSNEFIDGGIATATIGLAVNLGKNGVHADWINIEKNNDELNELKEKIASIEKDLIDSDQDGVADYLDREPGTTSGVTVNTKGVTVDSNRNGIPDEFEVALDKKYANQVVAQASPVTYDDAIKKLLNNGYVNVYFNTNSSSPANFSLDAVNYLTKYMNENPSAKADLIGYADQRGNSSYNSNLSSRRAKKVYDLLIESGISANRLSHSGNGEEASSNSKESLQLRRKVTFKLK